MTFSLDPNPSLSEAEGKVRIPLARPSLTPLHRLRPLPETPHHILLSSIPAARADDAGEWTVGCLRGQPLTDPCAVDGGYST